MNTDSIPEVAVSQKIKQMCTPGQTKEYIRNGYDEWADTYDNAFNPDRYTGHVLAAIACSDVIPEANRSKVLVLDLAAGTGLLGEELLQRGFNNLHALDPSTEMLEKARTRNIYQTFFEEFISEEQLPIDVDTYDIVVSSGAICQGHIPPGALWEMLRITRKGGYIIWSMRDEYLEDPKYGKIIVALIDKIEETGKWIKIKKDVIPNYYADKDGAVFVFKKT